MGEHRRSIFLLIVLAIVMRLLFLALFGGLDEQLHDSLGDQYTYLDLANSLINGHGFSVSKAIWVANPGKPTSIFPPLYPLFLALSFQLFGISLIPIRLIQILLSVIVVIVIYFLGHNLFNRRTGIIAGIMVATYPPLVMYVRPIMSEGFFFPLVALLVWATYKLDQDAPPKKFYALIWGLIAGLAILTRTEIVILVGLLLPYLCYHRLRKKMVRDWIEMAILLIALCVTLLPYSLYNYTNHGKLSPLPNARWKFWDHTWWAEMRTHPEWQGIILPEQRVVPNWENISETERDTYLWDMAIEFVYQHPRIFLIQRIERFFLSYPLFPREEIRPPLGYKGIRDRPDGYNYGATSLDDGVSYLTPAEKIRVWAFRLVAVLAVGGLFLLFSNRQYQAFWLILIIIWNITHSMAFVGSERLRLQVDPYLILFAAFFLSYLGSQVILKVKPLTQAKELLPP